MRTDEYAGGNIANEDVGVFGEMGKASRNPNHLSVHRICDGGCSRMFPYWPPALDDADYATCLEIPANDTQLSIRGIWVIATGAR